MRHWHYWIGTSQARLRTAFDQDEIEKFRSTNCLAASKFSVAVLISRVSTGTSPSSLLSPLFPGGTPPPHRPPTTSSIPFSLPRWTLCRACPSCSTRGPGCATTPLARGCPRRPPAVTCSSTTTRLSAARWQTQVGVEVCQTGCGCVKVWKDPAATCS